MVDDNTTDNFEWLDDYPELSANKTLELHISRLIKQTQDFPTMGAEYKKQIYEIKCFIEEMYAMLPTYEEEKDWEKERVFGKLKGDNNGK